MRVNKKCGTTKQGESEMKKNVWILNHYSIGMFFSEGGRHYWMAKNLKNAGYSPVIFGCNIRHGQTKTAYFNSKELWHEHKDNVDNIPFVAIKSSYYTGNGFGRVKNMAFFALNLYIAGKKYAQKKGKPDIIVASSVHPLTILSGELLAKYFKVPCICEIRDLWPESIFAYDPSKRKKWYANFLVKGEKYLYKNADSIVMTWAGGWQYIKDMGWEKEIPSQKVVHISNGVDYDSFCNSVEAFPFVDADLSKNDSFNAVYTGSIRRVNKVDMLVKAAEILKDRDPQINILIWGSGDKSDEIAKEITKKELTNIVLKGRVEKKFIPSILTQADCCLLHNESTELDRYGSSQNKFFEYLSSGRPILMTYSIGFSVIKEFSCGVDLEEQTAENIADALVKIRHMSEMEKVEMGRRAVDTVCKKFDFKILTQKLIDVIESL